jgi:hypothetical protein
MKIILSCLFLVLFTACAASQVTPFSRSENGEAAKTITYPVTNPAIVGIYRSTRPFTSFIELGLITFRSTSFDLGGMYDQIRKDAAKYGAHAVVDVKITDETHSETTSENKCSPVTTCEPDGSNCSTHDDCHVEEVPRQVQTFLMTGSMIRRKR